MLNIARKHVICVHLNKLLQTEVALARHTRAPSLSLSTIGPPHPKVTVLPIALRFYNCSSLLFFIVISSKCTS